MEFYLSFIPVKIKYLLRFFLDYSTKYSAILSKRKIDYKLTIDYKLKKSKNNLTFGRK
jgi:hypothetical protein